jgi:hypothetical protein
VQRGVVTDQSTKQISQSSLAVFSFTTLNYSLIRQMSPFVNVKLVASRPLQECGLSRNLIEMTASHDLLGLNAIADTILFEFKRLGQEHPARRGKEVNSTRSCEALRQGGATTFRNTPSYFRHLNGAGLGINCILRRTYQLLRESNA